jgi:hypothetical protein
LVERLKSSETRALESSFEAAANVLAKNAQRSKTVKVPSTATLMGHPALR